MNRERQLILSILNLLNQAFPYSVTDEQLRQELAKAARPPATAEEFQAVVKGLADRQVIRKQPDLLNPSETAWLITEQGKNLLSL